ncbi:hypothetical protein N0V88_005348 [Collariella sp. IMI 366227]|nr:hypothetical protein N0V88_005348 [Collariella sp. IMI 366227]
MFLHAGASLHGHEYSNRPTSQMQSPAPRRSPLLRSAFSSQKQRGRTDAEGNPPPALQQRPASDYVSRDPSPVVRFRDVEDEPPPTPSTTHDGSISDSELSDATLSLDGTVSSRSARRRRPHRAQLKTTYYLGYPAPRLIGRTKVMQKVFMPRLLLQLQKVMEDKRSHPVLEVFPAARIAGPVVAPRLSKRFPGIFGVKRHLGYDDIVLVRRDDNDAGVDGTESEHEEGLERRNLLAVYSPLKHSDDAEIVLDDGSVWVARPLPTGSFDFVCTDVDGNITTARWARRHTPSVVPNTVPTDATSSSAAAPQPRYTFSLLNPRTRRHPVMATLTPSTLDVQDTYTSVSSSHALHPPITRIGRSQSVTSSAPYSPPKPSANDNGENDSAVCIPSSPDAESNERTVHQIDDRTKMLIAVTAFWVALRSGWSQTYSPSASSTTTQDNNPTSPTTPTAPSRNCSRSRRNTWTRSSTTDQLPRSGDISSTESARETTDTTTCTNRRSVTGNPAGPTPSASRASTPTSLLMSSSIIPTLGERPLPRRATSTGASFMQQHLQKSTTSGTERGFVAVNGIDRSSTVSERGEWSESDTAGTSGMGSWRSRHLHLALRQTKHMSLPVPPPVTSPVVDAPLAPVTLQQLQLQRPLPLLPPPVVGVEAKRFSLSGQAWQSETEGRDGVRWRSGEEGRSEVEVCEVD